MLHTVNKSPFQTNSFERCLEFAKDGGAILMIEDGVYGAMKGSRWASKVEEVIGSVPIYALSPDVNARGIQDQVIDGVQLVDYGGFVDLVSEHNVVQSWL